ncbi:MAG: ferric reductase-like transmembrane domain-containing protein [Candidatus Aenigmarchaeota archaeon]|nr:ferric reductase-like transmembrane domain-containing protein [Candidatus Aenigmarchaeota archaeon]
MSNIKTHAFFITLFLLVYFSVKSFVDPQRQIVFYVSTFGFLSLLSIIFVISIPVLVKMKNTRFTTFLMAERRWIGIYTFLLALTHMLLVYNFFFGWDINKLLNHPNKVFLFLGSLALVILMLLAITSNNYSVKKLGKKWKKLHALIYLALLLVLIHSFTIGLIYFKLDWVKVLIIAVLALIFYLKFVKFRKVYKK